VIPSAVRNEAFVRDTDVELVKPTSISAKFCVTYARTLGPDAATRVPEAVPEGVVKDPAVWREFVIKLKAVPEGVYVKIPLSPAIGSPDIVTSLNGMLRNELRVAGFVGLLEPPVGV
jgi:hypothetical protein